MKKQKDSASNSVDSLDSNLQGLGIQRGQGSTDTLDKTKGHDGDNNSSNGLKKLMPSGLMSKRQRKRQELEDEQRAFEEASRGRTVAERGTLSVDRGGYNANEDDANLVEDDSEDDL